MVETITLILISIIVSAVVSLLVCRKAAAFTLEVIDGYVKDMIELAEDLIRDAYSKK